MNELGKSSNTLNAATKPGEMKMVRSDEIIVAGTGAKGFVHRNPNAMLVIIGLLVVCIIVFVGLLIGSWVDKVHMTFGDQTTEDFGKFLNYATSSKDTTGKKISYAFNNLNTWAKGLDATKDETKPTLSITNEVTAFQQRYVR